MVSERTHNLFMAEVRGVMSERKKGGGGRFKDQRQHQKKGGSLPQKFKAAFRALGDLAGALNTGGHKNLAMDVEGGKDDVRGRLRRVEKGFLGEDVEHLDESRGAGFSATQEAAKRLLKKIRPKTTRDQTVRSIARAIAKDPILMDWFYDTFQENGSIGASDTENILGTPILKWREGWGIDDEDSEFERLSGDKDLVHVIRGALRNYKPKGARLAGVNWTEAEHLVSGCENRIRQKRQKDALTWARRLVKALEAK